MFDGFDETIFSVSFENEYMVFTIKAYCKQCCCFFSDVLKYHILHGTLYSRGMHSGSFHTLEETDRLRIYESFFGLFNLRFTIDLEKTR